MKKVFICVFLVGLTSLFIMVLSPLSTAKRSTLNPVQVYYYNLKVECGDEFAVLRLCHHYVYGEKKDLDKATFWVDRLSQCNNVQYKSRVEAFRLGIEQMKGKGVRVPE